MNIVIFIFPCVRGYCILVIDPPIGGVPLPTEIIGSLIQPGMGAMYNYYYPRRVLKTHNPWSGITGKWQ